MAAMTSDTSLAGRAAPPASHRAPLGAEPAPLRVRRMDPAELPEVVDVWYRSFDRSVAYMRPEQRHSEHDARQFFVTVLAVRRELWVAEQGGRVVGLLALHGAELDRLYVDIDAQGTGVGTALLRRAQELHPEGLVLVTHQRNGVARRFYERHGFVAYAFGSSPPPENEPDVWYRWDPNAVP